MTRLLSRFIQWFVSVKPCNSASLLEVPGRMTVVPDQSGAENGLGATERLAVFKFSQIIKKKLIGIAVLMLIFSVCFTVAAFGNSFIGRPMFGNVFRAEIEIGLMLFTISSSCLFFVIWMSSRLCYIQFACEGGSEIDFSEGLRFQMQCCVGDRCSVDHICVTFASLLVPRAQFVLRRVIDDGGSRIRVQFGDASTLASCSENPQSVELILEGHD